MNTLLDLWQKMQGCCGDTPAGFVAITFENGKQTTECYLAALNLKCYCKLICTRKLNFNMMSSQVHGIRALEVLILTNDVPYQLGHHHH